MFEYDIKPAEIEEDPRLLRRLRDKEDMEIEAWVALDNKGLQIPQWIRDELVVKPLIQDEVDKKRLFLIKPELFLETEDDDSFSYHMFYTYTNLIMIVDRMKIMNNFWEANGQIIDIAHLEEMRTMRYKLPLEFIEERIRRAVIYCATTGETLCFLLRGHIEINIFEYFKQFSICKNDPQWFFDRQNWTTKEFYDHIIKPEDEIDYDKWVPDEFFRMLFCVNIEDELYHEFRNKNSWDYLEWHYISLFVTPKYLRERETRLRLEIYEDTERQDEFKFTQLEIQKMVEEYEPKLSKIVKAEKEEDDRLTKEKEEKTKIIEQRRRDWVTEQEKKLKEEARIKEEAETKKKEEETKKKDEEEEKKRIKKEEKEGGEFRKREEDSGN